MAPKKGFLKVSVGGMETTAGTAVDRSGRLGVTDFGYLVEKPTKSTKDVITGRNTNAGYDIDAIDYATELSTNLVASRPVGILLHSLTGVVEPPVQVGGAISIRYTGTESSCHTVVSPTAKTIACHVGPPGQEMLDSQFGLEGVLDLSGLTLGSLVTAINACTAYEAVIVYGREDSEAALPTGIVSAQAKNRSVLVHFLSSDSGVFLRTFGTNLENTENPTFSIQMDAVGDNQLGSGAVVDTATFSADLKAKAKASWNLMLLSVLGGQQPTTLELASAELDVMKFNEGETYLGGYRQCWVKNVSLTLANNHSEDEGYCQGSLSKAKHVRGQFVATGSLTLAVTDPIDLNSSESERKKNLSNEITSVQLRFTGRQLAEGIRSMLIFDLPTVQYTEDSKSASDNALEQSLSFEAIDIASYDEPVSIHMITDDIT